MGEPRRFRFRLNRTADPTGVSGNGTVALGVEWPDGTVTIRWQSGRPSTIMWDSLDDALGVHGHDGRTRVEWLDPEPDRCHHGCPITPVRDPNGNPLDLPLHDGHHTGCETRTMGN